MTNSMPAVNARLRALAGRRRGRIILSVGSAFAGSSAGKTGGTDAIYLWRAYGVWRGGGI